MSESNGKELYINFDGYIRQGEPSQREAAYEWSTAIGLQAVDGLRTSDYLNELARRNIEGEITIDEVEELLNSYYKSKTTREADDDDIHHLGCQENIDQGIERFRGADQETGSQYYGKIDREKERTDRNELETFVHHAGNHV